MGLSSSKQTTKSNQTATVAPSAAYSPYIDSAAASLKPSFDAATANNATLMPRVNSVLDYYGDTLAGGKMNGNPFLQSVIDRTNADVTRGVGSQFEGAGRYGSGMHAGILAKSLADNENTLRYQDYATERGYQDAAAGKMLPAIGVSSALPQQAAGTYADQIAALLRQYTTGTQSGTNTTKSTPSIMEILMQLGQNAGKAAAGGA
jgi:hypothetical protein